VSPAPLSITPLHARRFARRAVLLDAPVPDVASALAHLGFVQIDPINVCGRMHDLILRNRVRDYREGDLMRHLHHDAEPSDSPPQKPKSRDARLAFEHHLPHSNILVAFPLEAWPHLLATMQRRSRTRGPWSGRLTPREKILAERILAEIAARGPLSSDAFTDTGRARRVWGTATLAKSTLQKLFFHGRVLISHRRDQRRVYDLPERVLPPHILSAPAPSPAETARFLTLLKLRQRRLVRLTRDELPHVADLVQPLAIENCPALHCLRTDLPLLTQIGSEIENPKSKIENPPPLLLAPLDPLIYDRRITRDLWNFDYTWEAYTPPAKRTRGYYALPVLAGTEIVGHVDPKADRARRKLVVVSRSVRRGHRVAPALATLATFLGLRASSPPSPAARDTPATPLKNSTR
jgi:Uncharacterized protein conserved in bacteria